MAYRKCTTTEAKLIGLKQHTAKMDLIITFLQQPVTVINVLQLAGNFFHFGVYGAKPLLQHRLMSSMHVPI